MKLLMKSPINVMVQIFISIETSFNFLELSIFCTFHVWDHWIVNVWIFVKKGVFWIIIRDPLLPNKIMILLQNGYCSILFILDYLTKFIP